MMILMLLHLNRLHVVHNNHLVNLMITLITIQQHLVLDKKRRTTFPSLEPSYYDIPLVKKRKDDVDVVDKNKAMMK